jgi:hypothetical protein
MPAQSHMLSTLRTLRGPSVLLKTQRNRAVLLLTRFRTLCRSQIHTNLKIDADAGVAFVSGVQYIISMQDSEGSMLVSAHASTVYTV